MDADDIIKLIEAKISASELWAEAFAELDELDEISGNAIVAWMREDIRQSGKWDARLAKDAALLEIYGESAARKTREREDKKALPLRQNAMDGTMTARLAPPFLNGYQGLPRHVRFHFRKAGRLFRKDPWHRALDFKLVNPNGGSVYSARIDRDYRILGRKDGDEIIWFWIGSDYDYQRTIA